MFLYSCEKDNPVNDDALKSVKILNGTDPLAIDRGESISLIIEVEPTTFDIHLGQITLLDGGEDLQIIGLESLGGGIYSVEIEDKDNGVPYNKEISISISYSEKETVKTVQSNKVTVVYFPREYTYTMMTNETVYDNNNHAAFTGLINYQGILYLAFREGAAHRPKSIDDYGVIKILSNSGAGWTEAAVIRDETKDLRDPFLIEMDGKLRAYIGYNTFEGEKYQHFGSVYADFENGSWSDVKALHHDVPHIVWLWKVRKFKGLYYSVAYLEGEYPALLSSTDGVNWTTVTLFPLEGEMSEADMAFIGNTMYVCVRKDKPVGTPSFWGVAKYPFEDFLWNEMETCVESPELLRLPYSNTLLLAGRERQPSTGEILVSLFSANADGTLNRLFSFDAGVGGDKGYPGLAVKGNQLFCSYYTGHTTGTQVNISTLSIE